ncbi:hypothetical protein CLU79DRAFT_781801 [Phycomyces nitens]|nr:hypothetical protein CLU79DRAFT_781801 [Phycomyces nitens]
MCVCVFARILENPSKVIIYFIYIFIYCFKDHRFLHIFYIYIFIYLYFKKWTQIWDF